MKGKLMNIVYGASNFTIGIMVIAGSLVAMYSAFSVFGAAAGAFLAAMLGVVIFGWVLL